MTQEEVFAVIKTTVLEIVPHVKEGDVLIDRSLKDLGANSVDRAEIAMLAQESLGIAVPRVELFGPTNIGELADLLVSKLDRR
jgi:polyketide biosynthesis acyl carrier protein